ncbi:MAG: hypothetical protein LBT59_30210 [Clostridiales bacterium]|jgi:hypothetical protein|nr:hypothetical protein [Clostridiales bacterium]
MPKRLIVSFLICLCLASLVSCGKPKDSASADPSNQNTSSNQTAQQIDTFSYWIAAVESSEYYANYKDNPVLNYLLNNKTFPGKDGSEGKIAFDFIQPPLGKEIDNINMLISTNSYPVIIDTTFGTRVEDLFSVGKVMDLTDYVNNEMPNYRKFLDEHPDQDKFSKNLVDGKEYYLSLPSGKIGNSLDDQFFGINYRRDWIVKYGTQPSEFKDPRTGETKPNPKALQPFEGSFTLDISGNPISAAELADNVDGDSWVDDVVFPSGYKDPKYISDWNWMFEIFQNALNAQNIDDGYVLSIWYPGYIATGDIFSSFGGRGPTWSINPDGNVEFGATTDSMKSYIECFNDWWNKSWLDQRFAERSGDVFYRVDEVTYRQGKVGLWIGSAATLGTRLYAPENEFTKGLVSYGAPLPINDVYGAEETKLKDPYTMFGSSDMLSGGIAVTDKAKDKDILRLVKFIDYLYSEEGSLISTFGLTKEQVAQTQDPIYAKYNVDEAYTIVEELGQTLYLRNELLANDTALSNALTLLRIPHLAILPKEKMQMTDTLLNSRRQWMLYSPTGFLGGMNINQMNEEKSKELEKIKTRIEQEYMYVNIPKFIMGKKTIAADWDVFVSDVKKRNCDKVTEMYDTHIHGIE